MRKSGLHKQISSIFDGVPVPKEDGTISSELDGTSQDVGQENPAQSPVSQTPVQAPKSSLTRRLSGYEADQEEPEPKEVVASTVPAGRPMPLSKNQTVLKQKSGLGLSSASRKSAAKKSKMDPKQRKMTVLVGILSVVFAAVMFISLGGLGAQQKAKAADQTKEESAVQSNSKIKEVSDWKIPDPLPETMRDPIKPAEKKAPPVADSTEKGSNGQFSVRGIVFSKSRPSAIVNDVIVMEGQNLNGATIVKIEKDSVEFEMNGKRWTQPVQR